MRPARWLGALAIAAAIVFVAVDRHEPAAPPSSALYTCSMDPSVVADRPGTCPICGMALIQVTAEDRASGAVRIGGDARQRAGVQLAAVASRPRLRHVHATGDVVEVVDAGARAVIEARVYRGDPDDAQLGRTVAVALAELPLTELAGTIVVQPGRTVAVALPALTGLAGSIVDPTDRMRVEVDNRDQILRVGMRAELRVDVELPPALVVPAEAVVQAGARRIVFVDHEGKLDPRTPKLGPAIDGLVEVLDGLAAGDRVVVAGTFLVAAESRIGGGALWSGAPPR